MNIPVLLYVFIFVNCGLLSAEFANFQAVPTGRIVGGHEAKPHSHPYLVSLQLRFLWVRLPFCSGTILTKTWVLSAGHCIDLTWPTSWLPIDAVAGAHDIYNFGPTAQINQIRQRVVHPSYTGGIGPYDIAVLKTKYPFVFSKEVKAIQLPYDTKANKKNLVVPGWGALRTTVFIPDLPMRLQEVKVSFLPIDDCSKAIDTLSAPGEGNPLDKIANICTGPLGGGVAACSGDSGGPLVQYIAYDDETTKHDNIGRANNENNDGELSASNAAVLGIVSWGISPCGEKGAPTVYTNVSNYMDFITEHIYSE